MIREIRPRLTVDLEDDEIVAFYRKDLSEYGVKKAVINSFLEKLLSLKNKVGPFAINIAMGGEYDLAPRVKITEDKSGVEPINS
jgi:hypothetical protein